MGPTFEGRVGGDGSVADAIAISQRGRGSGIVLIMIIRISASYRNNPNSPHIYSSVNKASTQLWRWSDRWPNRAGFSSLSLQVQVHEQLNIHMCAIKFQ